MTAKRVTRDIPKYYYVTADLEPLLRRWCARESLDPPDAAFFAKLRRNLDCALAGALRPPRTHFRPLDGTTFAHLTKPAGSSEFWIALDDVYVGGCDYYVPITRLYDSDGIEMEALGLRPDEAAPGKASTLGLELAECAARYQRAGRPARVVLADDGTFTGGTIVKMIRMLQEHDVLVSEVRLGLATLTGLNQIDAFHLANAAKHAPPISFWPGIVISEARLMDWVCERDFFLGVPRSGRTYGVREAGAAVAATPLVGLAYVEGFGDMAGGSSIREGKWRTSAELLDYSIRLWEEVARVNPRRVLRVRDFPRFPGPDLDPTLIMDVPLVDHLKSVEVLKFNSARRCELREQGAWDEDSPVRS